MRLITPTCSTDESAAGGQPQCGAHTSTGGPKNNNSAVESAADQSVLGAMIRVLSNCTAVGNERDRYVLGYAKEAQRRLTNAAAAKASKPGLDVAAVGPQIMYTSMCPHTDGRSPL
jgi:hypothetical protein